MTVRVTSGADKAVITVAPVAKSELPPVVERPTSRPLPSLVGAQPQGMPAGRGRREFSSSSQRKLMANDHSPTTRLVDEDGTTVNVPGARLKPAESEPYLALAQQRAKSAGRLGQTPKPKQTVQHVPDVDQQVERLRQRTIAQSENPGMMSTLEFEEQKMRQVRPIGSGGRAHQGHVGINFNRRLQPAPLGKVGYARITSDATIEGASGSGLAARPQTRG